MKNESETFDFHGTHRSWIPACAGMTKKSRSAIIPLQLRRPPSPMRIRPRPPRRPDKPLTLLDRLHLGTFSAVAGALLGCEIAVFGMLLLDRFHPAIVAGSAAYFFAVGFVKGVGAGELAGEALGATASAVAAAGEAQLNPTSDARTGGASTLFLWLGYAACVLLALAVW